MWAEAWIGPDEWVPMDAALDGFDVGHIAITKSALEEVNPIVDLNTPVFDLMNSLKIEIVKTVMRDEMPPVVRPESAAPPAPIAETPPAPATGPSTPLIPPPPTEPQRRTLPPVD
jgi:hypothetical protein